MRLRPPVLLVPLQRTGDKTLAIKNQAAIQEMLGAQNNKLSVGLFFLTPLPYSASSRDAHQTSSSPELEGQSSENKAHRPKQIQ